MRCKTDEQPKAIADTDGLIGVYVLPSMLGPDATLATMLDHVDHIARLVGVDHVAIGTDTCYQADWPKGLSGHSNARFSTRWWGNWTSENHPLSGKSDEAAKGSLAWTNWPLYTVGLTALAQKVGEGITLEESVSNFLNIFSDEAAAGIRRNPMELIAGVEYLLGDQPAEALDGVPGPVNSTDVFTRYGDKLYQIVFSPSPFDNPQANADVWTLYDVVMRSFSFLP